MNHKLPVALATLLAAACGGDHDHDHDAPQPSNEAPAAGHPHVHTERLLLGELRLGTFTATIYQVAPFVPGQEADFDVDFPTATLPGILRGWIGVETGVGALKVRFEPETAQRMHGHPEVPNPIPDGSAIWFETDTASGPVRAALALPH